ncbi:MAG: hypothetical protein HYR75_02245 [Gemmatimonadetes bacterium]|nr:hypothetical protein [Gemmatimonadota bacterium]MBI3569298.1 hypothetical protein [Gemmatimonadota bacterium]
MTSHTARRLLLALPLLAAVSACGRNPEAEAKQQELNIQLGDAVNQFQGEHADLRATIDSLRYVIAKQDTTIQRMAAVTGVPIAK